jgi:hypothetical protein
VLLKDLDSLGVDLLVAFLLLAIRRVQVEAHARLLTQTAGLQQLDAS